MAEQRSSRTKNNFIARPSNNTPRAIPTPEGSSRRITISGKQINNQGSLNLSSPVGEGYVITSNFNDRRDYSRLNPNRLQAHEGIDLAPSSNNYNPEIMSAGSGRVSRVGYDANGYGNYVVVDHSNGLSTLYGHLDRVNVRQGQSVTQGFNLGILGSTGNSTGPHLHFGVIDRNQGRGNYIYPGSVNPSDYVNFGQVQNNNRRYRRQPGTPNQIEPNPMIPPVISSNINSRSRPVSGSIVNRIDDYDRNPYRTEAQILSNERLGIAQYENPYSPAPENTPVPTFIGALFSAAGEQIRFIFSSVPIISDLVSGDPERVKSGLLQSVLLQIFFIIMIIGVIGLALSNREVKRVARIAVTRSLPV